MPVKKELTGLDKFQADKAAEHFAGVVWPAEDSTQPVPTELQIACKKKARSFLKWRKGYDDAKLPTVRSNHFPHYIAYAAAMTAACEESLDMWSRRLSAGRHIRSREEESNRAIDKARKLMAELEKMGVKVSPEMLDSLIKKKQADEPQEEIDDSADAPPGDDEEAGDEPTPDTSGVVPVVLAQAEPATAPPEAAPVEVRLPEPGPLPATPEPVAPTPPPAEDLAESVEF